ncbi:hypothetical protein HMPREF1604_02210 [Escherichia coli 908519]|nr:hypothetical protein HMPREF1604_02210 [Escherichia coli 908519]
MDNLLIGLIAMIKKPDNIFHVESISAYIKCFVAVVVGIYRD